MKFKFSLLFLFILLSSCLEKTKETVMNNTKTALETNLWLEYSKTSTVFKLWSPTAENVKLNLYKNGFDGTPYETHELSPFANKIWSKQFDGDLAGTYYTYQIMIDNKWLEETPGIYAQAVGVNGKRAMVVDLESTNPNKWNEDQGPKLKYPNEAIIYELHIRDMTIHPQSGSSMPGKYLGLVEEGIKGPNGIATGIDHLKEMGITHVHLLPTYDHYSINETKLDTPQFNWGYDPQNYNVPEGSFSSNPNNGDVRIKEFKTMVKTFHDNGIGVILDVVYNHTGRTKNSNFNLEAPDYYYRFWEDGKPSDASACGNETASEKEMMRKFIKESVTYWAKEYHLDGFRFDLMGIHDITTMNEVADAVKKVNPNIFIYGEGWTAGDSPLPVEDRALKQHITKMPQITAFSDDIRDGLKGSVFDDSSTGFVSGAKNTEESVKFGIVGAIQHPQINYKAVNYSNAPWANEPWQSMSYVSCHDNHTLYDKLKVSRKDADEATIIAMNKLANAVVMTSQGVAFMHAGAEMLRTKNGEHNSYNLPDSINQIDWNWKIKNANVVDYYKNLIALRKAHPAFRMTSANDVRNNLEFKTIENELVSYQISNHANGDSWKEILVVYNANTKPFDYTLDVSWQLAIMGDDFNFENGKTINQSVKVPAISMLIAYRK
ncbi:type I pullulanase [Flaviramulus sp. BrNp1-15]|uniref:type I pullulanase n=1 Tax=Flaviramulus sp. BrNp1-15 TaxID=2916754 RepID=UPI001EE80FDE|nr:type I pullulanase [Flaviramulus sp. BrNp1-15]ULC59085.1 type I pullulanase [Flaviramulus sp. BrNp1-15]